MQAAPRGQGGQPLALRLNELLGVAVLLRLQSLEGLDIELQLQLKAARKKWA
jgi:hypothetical protein